MCMEISPQIINLKAESNDMIPPIHTTTYTSTHRWGGESPHIISLVHSQVWVDKCDGWVDEKMCRWVAILSCKLLTPALHLLTHTPTHRWGSFHIS